MLPSSCFKLTLLGCLIGWQVTWSVGSVAALAAVCVELMAFVDVVLFVIKVSSNKELEVTPKCFDNRFCSDISLVSFSDSSSAELEFRWCELSCEAMGEGECERMAECEYEWMGECGSMGECEWMGEGGGVTRVGESSISMKAEGCDSLLIFSSCGEVSCFSVCISRRGFEFACCCDFLCPLDLRSDSLPSDFLWQYTWIRRIALKIYHLTVMKKEI